MPSKCTLVKLWKLKLVLQPSRGTEKVASQTLDTFCKTYQTTVISAIQRKQDTGRLSQPFCVCHLERDSLNLSTTP